MPFVQPFDKRSTTLEREAPEVRCEDGVLRGATMSDHGYVILTMFPIAAPADAADLRPSDGESALAVPGNGSDSGGNALPVAPPAEWQDEDTFEYHCEDRKNKGYNSGMGEIFREVAGISAIPVDRGCTGLPETCTPAVE